MPNMTDEELAGIVGGLLDDCDNYYDGHIKPDLQRAQEYYDGDMKDTPSDEGRSKAISKDVRATIKKMLPSVYRVFFSSDKTVEYAPVAAGDEEGAEQATDYVNYIVLPESGGQQAIYDAMHDALLKRNGVLKWFVEKQRETQTTTHEGLDEQAAYILVADDSLEIVGADQSPDGFYTLQVKRKIENKRVVLECVPRSEFRIHPDAKCIDDSPIVAHVTTKRRGELIEAGYSKTVIEGLPAADGADLLDLEEDSEKKRVVGTTSQGHHPSIDEIEVVESFVRVDYDGDGIAELRRVIMAGGRGEEHIIENEPWDDMVPFGDLVAEREPHQWEGRSIPDDIEEVQRIKTVLLRNTLDNIYWQNNLQPIVQNDSVENPESVTNPRFGEPIRVKTGKSVADAVGYSTVPFVAAQSFQMLGYMDEVVTDRTGISDAASGLAPDALQNTTAKASAMIEQSGIAQTEMVVNNFAKGLQRVFKGVLRLIVQHQDKPRTVRLRDEWVTFDPRFWDASMDASVNTGLGAGTRERDMMALQMVMGLQEKLLASFGAVDNPFVKPMNLWNAVSRMVEAAGLKTVSLYFNKPSEDEIAKLEEAARNRPDPEAVKHKNAIELEEARAKTAVTREQARVEANRQIKQAEMMRTSEDNAQKRAADAQRDERRAYLEQQKLDGMLAIEREKIASQERVAMYRADLEIKKSQASAFALALGQGRAI